MNISQISEEDQLPNYKIIIVGRTSAGKTKLLSRYRLGTYTDDGSITVGVDHFIVKTPEASFSYYDTAGQDRYKSIVSSYFKGKDACLLVYDISSQKSFEEMNEYHQIVKQTIPNCLIYVVGCKSDLQKKVSEIEVKNKYPVYHLEITSAKKNENVQETFKRLEKQLLKTKKTENRGSKVRKEVPLHRDQKPVRKCCE